MIKNLIVADRDTGKTRHLITKCSQDEYSLIVCPTRMMCNYLSDLDKIRIKHKNYTKLERKIFSLFGLLHIVTWPCTVISCVMILFKYL